jgi:sporulation integral membrane protein YtvI
MSMKTILVVVVGLLVLYGLFTVGFPFLLALVIALFLEPVIVLFMKVTRLNRLISAIIVCTVFTVGFLGLAYVIGFKVISEFITFLKNLPDLMSQANIIFQDTLLKTQLLYDELPDEVVKQIQKAADAGMSTLINTLSTLSKSVINFAAVIPNLFIFFIVATVALYLIAFSLGSVKESFLSLFEESSREKVSEVLLNLKNSIFGFIRAQTIISGLTYLVALLGLLILQVDYALAIALLIIIVDILPILGTGSVLVPWAIYAIATGNSFLGIGLIVLFLVITVFRRTIEPKILGDSIGIGPLSTLVSLYVGFQLAGVVGIFLGPIVVILYQAMRKVGLLNIHIKLE